MNSDITTKIDTRITAVTPSIETRLRETIVTQNAEINDTYNFNSQKLTNRLAGTEDTDAVNFKQLKDISLAARLITENLNMNNKQITNLSNASENTDAVTLNQVNNLIEQKFLLNLDMGNNKFVNLQKSITDQDAATVAQTRNLNGHKITSLAIGTEFTDAVNFSQLTYIYNTIDDYV